MDNTRLYYLIDRWLAEELTRVELVELNDAFNGTEADVVAEQVQLYMDAQLQVEQFNFKPDLTAFHERLAQKIAEQEGTATETIKVRRMPWVRYAAAAAILFAIATTYFLLQPKHEQPALAQTQTERFKNDVLPGKPGTILRLANGKEILLDTVQNGSAINGFTKNANSLSVDHSNVAFATVIVPKGKAIQTITLADGSVITLNAESSLTFPTAFTKATREVSMTGEVYFEVMHDAINKPFIVSTPTDKIEVLGTHFNINAYAGTKTTLLEGKVKIGTAILKPGQQYSKGKITVQDSETLEQIMAWKNGMFRFNETTIHEIMDDVERAYDVKVVYRGETSRLHFSGAVPRTTNVSELLKKMELTKTVEFSIEGNTVTVRPK
jgi:transmembrane sensor